MRPSRAAATVAFSCPPFTAAGDCPLCMREVEMLQRRDAGKGRIAFVDVAAPGYDPAQHGGISFEAAMERIHAIEADGTILTGAARRRGLFHRRRHRGGQGGGHGAWVAANCVSHGCPYAQLAGRV